MVVIDDAVLAWVAIAYEFVDCAVGGLVVDSRVSGWGLDAGAEGKLGD